MALQVFDIRGNGVPDFRFLIGGKWGLGTLPPRVLSMGIFKQQNYSLGGR